MRVFDIITLFEMRVAIGSYPHLKEIINGKTVDTAFATLIKAVLTMIVSRGYPHVMGLTIFACQWRWMYARIATATIPLQFIMRK